MVAFGSQWLLCRPWTGQNSWQTLVYQLVHVHSFSWLFFSQNWPSWLQGGKGTPISGWPCIHAIYLFIVRIHFNVNLPSINLENYIKAGFKKKSMQLQNFGSVFSKSKWNRILHPIEVPDKYPNIMVRIWHWGPGKQESYAPLSAVETCSVTVG